MWFQEVPWRFSTSDIFVSQVFEGEQLPYDPFRRQLEQLRWEDGWRKRASGRAEAKLWDFAIIFICVKHQGSKSLGRSAFGWDLDGIFTVLFSFQSRHPLRIPLDATLSNMAGVSFRDEVFRGDIENWIPGSWTLKNDVGRWQINWHYPEFF